MNTSEIKEVIFAQGHKNILSRHKTTLEFTKDQQLSKKGDCIIAIAADKALTDLSDEFKEKMRNNDAKLTIIIEAGDIVEQVNAQGYQKLKLAHPTEIVIRKSDYVCSRTLAVQADKAAHDLSRELVQKLKNSKQRVKITLVVRV
ncbi:MAG: DUF371 domain-containing protein [Candidatus Bathyarchaeota archaeon]|nr:DUF371 domain-containing protein [Candidatus Bathyarchaeota archaeon]